MKLVMPWRLFGSTNHTRQHLSQIHVYEYALMVMPAALVGPVMSSALSRTAMPGESMESTSTELAFAAKT